MNAVSNVITSNGTGCREAVMTDTGCWTNGNVSRGVDSSCILMLAVPEQTASLMASLLNAAAHSSPSGSDAITMQLQQVQVRITVYPSGTSSFPTSCLVFVAAPPSDSQRGGLSSKEVVIQDWALNRQQVISGAAAANGLTLSVPLSSLFNVATLIGSPRRQAAAATTPGASPPPTMPGGEYPLVFLGLRFVGCTDLSGTHRIRKIRVEIHGAEKLLAMSGGGGVPESAQRQHHHGADSYSVSSPPVFRGASTTPYGTDRAMSLSPREVSVGVTSNAGSVTAGGGVTTPRKLQLNQQQPSSMPPPAPPLANSIGGSSNGGGLGGGGAPVTRTHYESNVLMNNSRRNSGSGLVPSIPTSPDTSVIEVEIDKYVETPPLPLAEGSSSANVMTALYQQQQPPPLPHHHHPTLSPERPRTGSQLPVPQYAIPSSPPQPQQNDESYVESAVSPLPAAPPIVIPNRRPLNSASALDVDLSPLNGAPGSENPHSRVEAARSRIEHITRQQEQERSAVLEKSLQEAERAQQSYNHDNYYSQERHLSQQRQHIREIASHLSPPASQADSSFYGPNKSSPKTTRQQQQRQQQSKLVSPTRGKKSPTNRIKSPPRRLPQQQQQQQQQHEQKEEQQSLNRIAFNASQYYDLARSGRLNVAPSSRFSGTSSSEFQQTAPLSGPHSSSSSQQQQRLQEQQDHSYHDHQHHQHQHDYDDQENMTPSRVRARSNPHHQVVAPPSPKQPPVVIKSPPPPPPQQQLSSSMHSPALEQQIQAERDHQHLSAIERAHAVLKSVEHTRERSASAGNNQHSIVMMNNSSGGGGGGGGSIHRHPPRLMAPPQPQQASSTLDQLSDRMGPLTSGLREITSRLNHIIGEEHLKHQQQQQHRDRSSSAPPVLASSSVERYNSPSRQNNNNSNMMNASATAAPHYNRSSQQSIPSFMQQHTGRHQQHQQQQQHPAARMMGGGGFSVGANTSSHSFVPVPRRSASASPPMPDFIPSAAGPGGNASQQQQQVPPFLRTMQRTSIPGVLTSGGLLSGSSVGGISAVLPSASAVMQSYAGAMNGSTTTNTNATTMNHSSFLLSRATTLDRTHGLLEEARGLVSGAGSSSGSSPSPGRESRKFSPSRPMAPGTFSVVEPNRNARAAHARSRQPPVAPRVSTSTESNIIPQVEKQQPPPPPPQSNPIPASDFATYREQRMQPVSAVAAAEPLHHHHHHHHAASSGEAVVNTSGTERHVQFSENVSASEAAPRHPPPTPRVKVMPKVARSTTPPSSVNSSFSGSISGASQQQQQQQQQQQNRSGSKSPIPPPPKRQQSAGGAAVATEQPNGGMPVYQYQMAKAGGENKQPQQRPTSPRKTSPPPPPAAKQQQRMVSVVDASPTTWKQTPPPPSPSAVASGAGSGAAQQHVMKPPRFGPSSPALPDSIAEIAVPVWKHHLSKRQAGDFMLLLSRLKSNAANSAATGTPGVFVELQPRAESEMSPDSKLVGGRVGSVDREGSVPRPTSSVVEHGKAILRTGQSALSDPALHKNCVRGDGSWAIVLRMKMSEQSPQRREHQMFESMGPLVVACEFKSGMDFKRAVEFLSNTLNIVPV